MPGWPARQVVVVADLPLPASAAPKKEEEEEEERGDGDGWQYIETEVERGEDRVQPADDDEQTKGSEAENSCLPQPRTDDRGEGAEPQYRQLVNGMSVRLYRWMQGVGIGCQRKRKLPPGS